jgi:hypothetical protein
MKRCILQADDKVVEGNILMELRKSYGVCVPKGCTIEDLRNLSNSIEEEFQSPAHFHFVEEYCDGGEKPPFSAAAIVAMSVRVEATRGCYNFSVPDSFFPLSPSSSSAAPSTTYFATSVSRVRPAGPRRPRNDRFFPEKSPNLFVAFSVLTNTQRLLATQTTESTLGCLNGMRVISMMWIVIAHGFQFAFFTPEVNAVHILWVKSPKQPNET